MFEFDQSVVDRLLLEDAQFSRLYQKHHALNAQVQEVHSGQAFVEDLELETWKKQKLLLKDKMAALIAQYRRASV